jgi:hypothetical protein
MKAVPMSDFDVESMRAEPFFIPGAARSASAKVLAVLTVPKVTRSPGPTVSAVVEATLIGLPPAGKNNSTPTVCGVVAVDVHEK